uniref:Acetyl-CoA carboxylase carboxyltransferase beta subunit n=1 Tax=Arceuthobium rubrum TaxID=35992 RepID=A0A7T1HF74_9MAGN|nr:acetyl-CoA carboxylase carboxyltransferase beta subunit [Arceuthobium rubrum]
MNKWWFINHSMLFNEALEHGIDSPIETSRSEDQVLNMEKYMKNRGGGSNSSYSTIDDYFCYGVRNILFNYEILLIKDKHKYGYYIFFDIENLIFKVENDHFFLSDLEIESKLTYFHNSSYLEGSKSDDTYYDSFMYDKKYRWKNHIINCIDSLIHYQFLMKKKLLKLDNKNHSDNYRFLCGNHSESDISSNMMNGDFTKKKKKKF